MAIVFLPVKLPSSAKGGPLQNGKLTPCDLEAVWFPGVGHLSLHKHTARAFKMMQVVCYGDLKLHMSGTGAYRSYESQVALFLQRYTDTYLPLRNVTTSTRTYQGKTWYLRRGMAPAASPGTSNHGYGIAIDLGWWTGVNAPGLSDIAGITSKANGWKWLQDNAESFGFSWEGAKPGQAGWEPWHLRHVVGNDVTQRVKDVERFLGIAV